MSARRQAVPARIFPFLAWPRPGKETLRDAERFHLAPVHEAIGIVRLDASLNFVTAAALEDAVLKPERDTPRLKFILLTAGSSNDLDARGDYRARR